MPEKVILIGENHFDLDKPNRYRRAFRKFEPDVITIEATKSLITGNTRELENMFNGKNPTKHQREIMESVRLLCYNLALEYQRSHNDISVLPIDSVNHCEAKAEEITPETTDYHAQMWEQFFSGQDVIDKMIMDSVGAKFFEELRDRGWTIDQATNIGMYHLVLKSSEIDLREHRTAMDMLYFIGSESDPETIERDDVMLESIMQQKGVVLHSGGSHHIFGNYDNLFARIQRENTEVERYKLLDFNDSNPDFARGYIRMVRRKFESLTRPHTRLVRVWE